MKQYLIIGTTTALLLLSSCGAGNKDNAAILKDKKDQLEKLKADEKTLQDEIDKLDTSSADAQKAKLVTVQTIQTGGFNHYIKLQGHIDAQNISYIAPRGNPGVVKAIFVKQGDIVKKGQLLLKLDDAVLKQTYTTALQGITTAQSQLAHAQDIYQRRKNLWDENIGTQVDLINAKNDVTSAEDQLKTAEETAKQSLEQLNTTNVTSDVDGVADQVNVRVGETFQGVTTQGPPQIEIVNNSVLKVVTTIPQNYINNVKQGSDVIVAVPDINKSYNTSVSFVSASIDASTNGFEVDAKLPSDASLKPNQIAEVQIKDYTASDAIVVPVETLQNDLTGKYVLVAATENGKLVARKRSVTIGKFTDDQLEITSGLKPGDVLITQGFQGLYDGQLITTQ
jgi:membrane fusion protein (multidrug efflux system)